MIEPELADALEVRPSERDLDRLAGPDSRTREAGDPRLGQLRRTEGVTRRARMSVETHRTAAVTARGLREGTRLTGMDVLQPGGGIKAAGGMQRRVAGLDQQSTDHSRRLTVPAGECQTIV